MVNTGVYHVQYSTSASTSGGRTYPATHGYMRLTTTHDISASSFLVDISGIFNSTNVSTSVGGTTPGSDTGGSLVHCESLATTRQLTNYVSFASVNVDASYNISTISSPISGLLPGFITDASGVAVTGVTHYEIHSDRKIFAEVGGTYTDISSNISFLTIAGAASSLDNSGVYVFGGNGTVHNCFLEGTKIHAHVHDKDVYVNVEDLRKGDLVNTYLHGKKAIKFIGKDTLFNTPDKWNGCLKKLPKSGDATDDLFITGAHSLLVDELSEKEAKVVSSIYGTADRKVDDKFLLNAWASEKAKPVLSDEFFTIYHFVLEHDGDENKKYGVWANGFLVESQCEKHFLAKTV